MNGLNSAVSENLSDKISSLRQKALRFNVSYALLLKSEPDTQKFPTQYKKWLELKKYGEKTRASVNWLTGAVDSTGRAVDSIYYGITHPFGSDVFGLGVLPLIPVVGVAVTGAVIASSIAAMTYFITQAYEYGKFADASPEVRAELKKQTESGTIGGALTSVKGIMFIGAAIYLLPKIFAMMKARK